MITNERYIELKANLAEYDAWALQFRQRNGWTVIPADAVPPVTVTNADRSAVEVYEFCSNPPDRYTLYINEKREDATTWTGDGLGRTVFGREYRDNFGGRRVPVTIYAINGRKYVGTYYKSAGDYARVRQVKTAQKI